MKRLDYILHYKAKVFGEVCYYQNLPWLEALFSVFDELGLHTCSEIK